jgi:hypothetical protein
VTSNAGDAVTPDHIPSLMTVLLVLSFSVLAAETLSVRAL